MAIVSVDTVQFSNCFVPAFLPFEVPPGNTFLIMNSGVLTMRSLVKFALAIQGGCWGNQNKEESP